MKIQNSKFKKSAINFDGCPAPDLPEFAFIGRSNVGKSSLINLLTNKEGLARVSKTPGRTREINFFSINDSWNLVDLPGYGYAKVSKSQRDQFNEFVSDYLINRETLTGIFVLIDSRHPPQKIDLEFLAWLIEAQLPFALIFTKTDKSKPKLVRKNIGLFLERMKEFSEGDPIHFETSTTTRTGRKEVLKFIETAISNQI
ncbi:ribosome biogenesis GTP-binding protein YihA/YsxC [Akkermansiaceae bacterium]|nr:ribosome biogenesis GTP-binding protein YihA/YsxC [bacterium]MDA7919569.1 ribosome biogenesis GTP-binding protein YihA/YsxC [Akkermansiaceae bacterium]MDB4468748.1 ribosome biogenesis GTP-binding protein YihA/YsxC [Akkermansiaceae bacterium]MDB4512688.1 ribosome biogenesis GTP-binding protein YihA/YsxC [Akkermansiaceae bacterium]MDB4523353.1 ribosome biogenesis GTP-binding protein YihA/YsxC [Akkermansiaceae bacterium]